MSVGVSQLEGQLLCLEQGGLAKAKADTQREQSGEMGQTWTLVTLSATPLTSPRHTLAWYFSKASWPAVDPVRNTSCPLAVPDSVCANTQVKWVNPQSEPR